MSRRKGRIAEVIQEYENAQLQISSEKLLSEIENERLFTIDTVGRARGKKYDIQNFKVHAPLVQSKTEQKLISKFLKKCQNRPPELNTSPALMDIWDTTDLNPSRDAYNTSHRKLLALPGQSYNPSHLDHQNLLAEAAALEIIKAEAATEKEMGERLIVSCSAAVETKLDVDIDDDDKDDIDTHESTKVDRHRFPSTKPVTRSKKNKRRKRNEEMYHRVQSKINEDLLASIDQLPKILDDMTKEVQHRKAHRAVVAARKETNGKGREGSAVLTYEEAVEVPLTDELGGGLRQLLPKGLALRSRLRELSRKGLVTPLRKKGRGKVAHVKPHAAKKIIWHAKYKY